MSDRCLIIFAKEPAGENIKTRLHPWLSTAQRLELYQAFLKDIRLMSDKIHCERRILAYDALVLSKENPVCTGEDVWPFGQDSVFGNLEGTGAAAAKSWSWTEPRGLKNIFRNFEFYQQTGRDLGEKMHQAFEEAGRPSAAFERLVIIGSDAPTLPAEYVQSAFEELWSHDLVLGPADDGGYYLLGLKKSEANFFQDVPWSTPRALEVTYQNALRCDKRMAFLPRWYDIDTIDDLQRLGRELKNQENSDVCPATRAFLQRMSFIEK